VSRLKSQASTSSAYRGSWDAWEWFDIPDPFYTDTP
jgi:hypothetical protein